jgi:hypothetical protein
MPLRMGELLVSRRLLTEHQLESILRRQTQSGKPFGVLAEEMYGIDPQVIEDTWADQYVSMAEQVNPLKQSFDPEAMNLISRRQAWQFRVLPIRFDDGALMVATTHEHLRRALRFATRIINVPCYFVIATPADLGEALCMHYALPGLTPRSVFDDALDHLLGLGPRYRSSA